MKRILIIGTGKSSGVMIDYLIDHAAEQDWHIRLADQFPEQARKKCGGAERTSVTEFNVHEHKQLRDEIEAADLVISMLPARFHELVARQCLVSRKNLITPSYVSKAMREMDGDVRAAGLTFLNELGVDPGIDHMSAKKVIDQLQAEGHEITGFESFTGGLVAPESDDNPWRYKFTWNPRNVVLAGQGPGGVKFLHNGKYKYVPYHKLFSRIEKIEIPEYGDFIAYANRDSLQYREIYGLENVSTMYRGTFRRPGFCRAWDILVQIGATDDTYELEAIGEMTKREFTNSFLKYRSGDSVELKLANYLGIQFDSEEMKLIEWLGLFSTDKIGLERGTPAQILQHILQEKWSMRETDKDMIVMLHLFNYWENNKEFQIRSHLITIGDDSERTAMAKTVGLPLAIAAKLLLNGKIKKTGVLLPITPDIYNPILAELEELGIKFTEEVLPA